MTGASRRGPRVGDRMNFIVLMCDTFRRDHVGCYDARHAATPNLDRLASDAVIIDGAYSGSFPTLPCRAELFTGRFAAAYLDWGPLPRAETLLAEVLARNGYTCALISDNYQLLKPGYDYDRGFHTRIRIRGQGQDPVAPADLPVRFPCAPEKLKRPELLKQYLRNTSLRRGEPDHFAPQVMQRAMDWLETEGRRARFFLWIDCFDPHEPWDPPPAYVERTLPSCTGDPIILPRYGPADNYSEAELHHIRALYRGEVEMVDAWIGKLLGCIDTLDLRADTCVVFLSDHGIYLGERGLIGKMGGDYQNIGAVVGWPPHPELSEIPMLWRVPGLRPGRRRVFAHPGDVSPTLLDLAEIPPPERFTMRSLLSVLRDEMPAVRDTAVSSWSLRCLNPARPSVIRTDEWTLVLRRGDLQPALYHRPSDPGEHTDVYARNRGAAAELHARYVRFLQEQETPMRHLWPRRWLLPFHAADPALAGRGTGRTAIPGAGEAAAPDGSEPAG